MVFVVGGFDLLFSRLGVNYCGGAVLRVFVSVWFCCGLFVVWLRIVWRLQLAGISYLWVGATFCCLWDGLLLLCWVLRVVWIGIAYCMDWLYLFWLF